MNKKFWMLTCAVIATAGMYGYSADMLTSGRYLATVTPAVDDMTAATIQSKIEQVPEIRSAQVNSADSSIHFTVKDNAHVDLAKVQSAVQSAAPGHLMGTPTVEPRNPPSVTDRAPGQATGH